MKVITGSGKIRPENSPDWRLLRPKIIKSWIMAWILFHEVIRTEKARITKLVQSSLCTTTKRNSQRICPCLIKPQILHPVTVSVPLWRGLTDVKIVQPNHWIDIHFSSSIQAIVKAMGRSASILGYSEINQVTNGLNFSCLQTESVRKSVNMYTLKNLKVLYLKNWFSKRRFVQLCSLHRHCQDRPAGQGKTGPFW